MHSLRSSLWMLGLCALVVALPLVAPPPVAYAGTTGVISGKVLDEHNAPVSAAKVTATSPSQTASGVTNGSGFFSLLNLSPDTYTVTLVKQAYQTTSAPGITVQADQISHVDIVMHTELHTIGRVTTTAQAGLVSKNVTGDLYTVNAQKINSYQGSAGGAETLYSQNGVVGSLPGVTRTVGTGGGYAGNGSLSVRGGSNDQIGFELEGIPLNRAFDSANGTAFLTNGLSSLEVYTGGEPADAGRSMSGYINEIIRRGSYPGGGDFTFVIGTPALNNTYQADIYGGTPNKRFTYYASLLWINAGYNFGNSSNLDNTTINVPANDPGCPLVNVIITGTIPCASPNSFNAPISSGAWQSFLNPLAHMSDGVINLNWTIEHNGLSDDLQALYNTGYTWNPFLYSGPFVDPAVIANCGFEVVLSNPCPTAPGGMTWPYGMLYTGPVAQPLNTNPSSYYTLTWPTSGQSLGLMPSNYLDSQTTQSAIEKLSYTRALTPSSFVRLYGYMVYSLWNFNQATNVWQGDSFYDLHDNAGGVTANYQNQLSQQHLIRADVDYLQERSLRYNYAPNSAYPDDFVNCFPTTTVNYGIGAASLDYGCTGAFSGTPEAVAQINGPYAYYNSISPTTYDAAIADTWRPSDRWTVDVGFRWDDFVVPLMPLQITGPNGVAELAQNQSGTCLHGYAYAPTEPCAIFLNASGPTASGGDGTFGASALPGAGNWTNVSGSLNYTYFSPRLGITYTASATDVIRASVGRYVQPPATAYEEYIGAPQWGATDTVAVLNNFYDGLGFTAVHNVQPQDSTNYDASYEHDFKNGMSMKVSPFYRVTRGQILNLPVNPLQPTFETGYNFGAAKISGFEFLAADNHQGDGWNGTLSATYTNSKIRFEAPIGGSNFIDTVNQQITNYNNFYGTNYALFDPNGYYPPSLFMSPGNTGASYDVAWVLNLNATYQHQGWEISPTFNYQSGNPYGDPLNFPDPNGNVTFGPDPYTHQFDSLGAFKGPWWLTMNLAVSRDITHNVKASLLYTNVFTIVGNHGYVWEVPSSKQVVSYGDNFFYTNGGSFAGVNPAYTGDSYYPYAPESINPYHQLIFSISTRI